MAADVARDVVVAHLLLRQGQRGEDRTLGAAGAEARRTTLHEVAGDARCERTARVVVGQGDDGQVDAVQQLRGHLADERVDALGDGTGGVLAGHGQQVLAMQHRGGVVATKNRLDVLLDEVRLSFLDEQHSLLVGAELHDFVVDDGVGDVHDVERDLGVAVDVRKAK